MSFVSHAVAESGSTYATDDDPELVRGAVPFGLKTMEGLLAENPDHEGLLRALAGNFTQIVNASKHWYEAGPAVRRRVGAVR